MRKIVAALAAGLFVTAGSGVARAQSASQLPESPASPAGRFVGLDVFVGGAQIQNELAPATDTEDAKYPKWGWDAGATLSLGVRWFGLAASIGRQAVDDATWINHLAVGPRVTSPWIASEMAACRFFAHALAGVARTGGPVSRTAGELVVGGGMDFLVLRIQGDYVRTRAAGVTRGNGRVFVGAVVPLCLRGCTEADGFNVSGRPTAR